ncbi:MAG: hypothetical protein HC850_02945 [Rhodomicrobium sp.]|nr:hypothetical protein [Rhodomicrobium sp.]
MNRDLTGIGVALIVIEATGKLHRLERDEEKHGPVKTGVCAVFRSSSRSK